MRGKKRSPEERVSNVAGPLPPCKVCGEPAAGYHYGANTCEACKGFFRRSLLRNGDYVCIGTENCVIGSNRRKSCPKCRYNKCLNVGMSKEAIKTGRYTYMKRTQDTLEIKQLTESQKTDSPLCQSLLSSASASSSSDSSQSQSLSQEFSESAQSVNDISDSGPCGGSVYKDVMLLDSAHWPSTPPSDKVDDTPHHFFHENTDEHLPTFESPISQVEEILDEESEVCDTHLPSFQSPKSQVEEILAQDSGICETHLPAFESSKSEVEEILAQDSGIHETHLPSFQSPTSQIGDTLAQESLICDVLPLELVQLDSKGHLSEHAMTLTDLLMHGEPESTWLKYSEFELDDFIRVLVSSHREIVEDLNCVSDEILEKKTKECKEKCQLQAEIFGQLGKVDIDEHEHIYNTTGIDVDGRIDDINYCTTRMDSDIRQIIAFMKRIPGFRDLSITDQTELVKGSITEVLLLGYYKGYNIKEYIAVEVNRSYCYHQMINFYSKELIEKIFRVTHQLQQIKLNFDSVVVLKVVCIFFPDRVNISRYDHIERIHHKVIQALLLLLKRQFSDNYMKIFAKIISFLTSLRSLVLECRKLWDDLNFDRYEEVANKPILAELFKGGVY